MKRSVRRAAWLLIVVLLAVFFFSAFFAAQHAHHDCAGEGCSDCARLALLASSRRALQTVLSAVFAATVALLILLMIVRAGVPARRAQTPVLLKIKLRN